MEKTLETQLLEFQKKISVIKKDAKNPHFKNTYATLTQILSEVKPVLNELGVVITQPIVGGKVCTELSFNGVKEQSYIELPSNLSPQQLGSAITYFRRYTLASLLALEIDDDDAQSTTTPTTQEPKLDLLALEKTALEALKKCKTLVELKTTYDSFTTIQKNIQTVITEKDKLKQTLK